MFSLWFHLATLISSPFQRPVVGWIWTVWTPFRVSPALYAESCGIINTPDHSLINTLKQNISWLSSEDILVHPLEINTLNLTFPQTPNHLMTQIKTALTLRWHGGNILCLAPSLTYFCMQICELWILMYSDTCLSGKKDMSCHTRLDSTTQLL